MKKKLLAALLATAMTVTMFAGCGTPGSKDSKKDDSSASSGKKRITYTLREDLPSMDPQNSNSISCATAEICTYAMLTRNVEGEIKPDAAESWDISDDGLTYTFHLRDGLKWSDGEDVKAGDYVYGIQRLMDPEMASDYAFIGYILKNGAEVNSGSVPVDELGVSAPDDKTVVIELAHPATYFLSMAAMATFGPARKDYVEKYGKEYAADPEKSVYNGPFKMTEWKHGDEMILSKNENYWDADSIKLDEICVKTVADANKNLRFALNYAINRTEYNKLVNNDVYDVAQRLVLPNVQAADDQTYGEAYPYTPFPAENDNDKAKEYLDAAMKEMGVSNPADIKITLLTTDTDGAKKQAEVLQEQYQKNLGITVEINQVTYKQRLQMETEKDYDMVVTGWVPDYSDAYSYLELWISDGQYNHSGYANAEYDKLLKDSQTETDAKTRQDMLFQAEQIFLGEDSALVPLQLRRDQYLINPKISNFNVYFVGYDFDLVYADISE